MSEEASFDNLMVRLRAGDEEAAAQVFHRFANRLIGLARRRLDPVVRRKIDPEDVLQSVFRSFFHRQAEGQFELSDWNSLWSMLVVLTIRKCGRRVGYFHAARRDVHREVVPTAGPDDSAGSWETIAREPSPEEAAALAELVAELMRRLDERERVVLTLSLQGWSVAEISGQIGRTERTVQRILDRIRTWLRHQQAASCP